MKHAKVFFIALAVAVVFGVSAVGQDGECITGAGEDFSASEMISLMVPEVKKSKEKSAFSEFLIPLKAGEGEEKIKDADINKGVNILIYHTHTTEAYRQVKGADYKESGSWRTKDNSQNIVAVGEVLKASLEEQGFNVIHDITDHEPPKLSTAYDRSVVTMKKYKKKYPEIDLYIDLHRDALSAENLQDYVTVGGEECARMMFVVGKGEGFEDAPDFSSNYAFAEKMTDSLKKYDGKLMRDICIKKGRYNQHIGPLCCLIEIGHNRNTIQQAKNSAKLFAAALGNTVAIDKNGDLVYND